MKRFEQDRLLREILEGQELSDLRRISLDQGLASIRRRHHLRRVTRVCALALLPVLLLLPLLPRKPSVAPERPPAYADSSPARSASPEKTVPIKFITDEQLLALFPDRPIALIGRPGQQQLVFLDRSVASRHADRP